MIKSKPFFIYTHELFSKQSLTVYNFLSLAKIITIAIDGYSSTGKSTIARALAEYFDFIYIDTGAMYRAVSLYFLRNNTDIHSSKDVSKALDDIKLDFKYIDGHQIIHLNNEPVEKFIRSNRINNIVSPVAKISSVRSKMVALQRKMSEGKSVVMDGRDIGTVVFPNADLKFFMTSNIDVRVNRRFNELESKGVETTLREVEKNLLERDHIDSTRQDSPLKQATDALLIDNTNLSRNEQLDKLVSIVNEYISKNKN